MAIKETVGLPSTVDKFKIHYRHTAQVRTWKNHWPNFPAWPPLNPSPSEGEKRGLKYALTLARIDSIYNVVLENESKGLSGAKGHIPVVGGCY